MAISTLNVHPNDEARVYVTKTRFENFGKKHSWLLFLVLLILVGLGAYGYLWWQGRQKEDASVVLESSLDEEIPGQMLTEEESGDLGGEINFGTSNQFLLRRAIALNPNNITTMKVDVPAGLTRIRTIISAPITVGNSLIGPDNIVYDSILSQSGAAKEQYRTFTINDPLPGEWTIEIRNRNFESEERVLVAVEETGSPIELQMGVSGPDSSRRLTIYAKVVDSGKILKDLEMNAEFQYVGLSSNIYQMYDDGEHNDGLPNDGIYAASSSSLTPGGHLIIVTARNEELVRIAAVSVYIPE